MAWEENSRICLHMQLIAILSRIGVLLTYTWFMAKHFYCFSKFCQYFTKVRIVISDDYSSNIVYSIFIYQNKVHTY